ncbi:hypothetical protein [Kineococcus sp. G2]|uniref:hypothetical protein n=1 Tax=Kineococcus sp. G2 TaxID=3127484 RepID=UPI00301D119B
MRGTTAGTGSGTRGLRSPMALLFGQAVAGVLLGAVWWALARRPSPWLVGEPVVVSGAAYPIARDGSFAVLTALVGLVAAALVLRWAREHPLPVLVAALAGALAGSLLTVATAGALPPSDPSSLTHVSVYAWAVVLVQPLVLSAVVAVVALARALVDWTRSED